MNIEFKINTKDHFDSIIWDDFVLTNAQCHRMQTSLWADTKALTGWIPYYITAREGGNLVAGAQLYEHKIPLFGFMVCLPKGPLSDSRHLELLPDLLSRIKKWAGVSHKFCLLVQPADQSCQLEIDLLREKFSKIPDENIVPPGTIVIDLSQDTDTLFKSMTHGRRRNIHSAQKAGIEIKEGIAADLDTFYALYQNTGRYLNFELDDKTRFENIWRILSPFGHIKLFISFFDEKPLSALLLLCFGHTATAWRFGSSRELPEKHPNDVLVWHSIVWAKEHGYRYFDFGEIHLQAARNLCNTNDLENIHPHLEEYGKTSEMFKLSFGGTPVLYPETYIYFPNPILRWLYEVILSKLLALPIAQKIMKHMA